MRRGSGSAEATALEGRSRRRAPNRNWLQSIWRVPYLQLAAPARHASWDVIRTAPEAMQHFGLLGGAGCQTGWSWGYQTGAGVGYLGLNQGFKVYQKGLPRLGSADPYPGSHDVDSRSCLSMMIFTCREVVRWGSRVTPRILGLRQRGKGSPPGRRPGRVEGPLPGPEGKSVAWLVSRLADSGTEGKAAAAVKSST